MVSAADEREGVDFDPFDEALRGPQFWDAIHELQRHGPLVWVRSQGGYWAVTGYDAVRQVAQNWRAFPSGQGVSINRPSEELQPYVMPIEVDPPRQKLFRIHVNPFLTPQSIERIEDGIRDIADELIDKFIERGHCDFAVEFARLLPGTVFFRLVAGVPDEMLGDIEPLARQLSFDPDPMKRAEAARLMREWAATILAARSGEPDVPDIVRAVNHLADVDPDIADHELASGLMLLAQGGIGTTSQLIGSAICIMSDRPELQERVRADLDLVPALLEETLRSEPPVAMMFRHASQDIQIEGRQIEAGQLIGLFFAGANRDPAVFERPDEFDIDRTKSPHMAFGLGVHRCIGSNLARTQARIAIEQTMKRLTSFRIPPGAPVQYVSASQRGPSSVPLEFTPGPALHRTASSRGSN